MSSCLLLIGRLGFQILRGIESIHDVGFLHRQLIIILIIMMVMVMMRIMIMMLMRMRIVVIVSPLSFNDNCDDNNDDDDEDSVPLEDIADMPTDDDEG